MRGAQRAKTAKGPRPSLPSTRSNSDPFARRTMIAVGITAVAVLCLLVIGIAADVLLLIFAGILLAVLLRSLGDWVAAHTPLSRGGSLAVVMLLLIGLLGWGSWSFAPDISQQVDQLFQHLPRMVDQLDQRLAHSEWGRRLLAQTPRAAEQLTRPSGLISRIAGLFSTTFGLLADMVLVLLIALYMAADPAPYRNGLIRLLPFDRRERAREVLDQLGETLRWWLVGRVIAMLVIGVLTALGLWLIGIELALALGLLAGLLNFVPYLGPFLSAVPPLLIALGHGPTKILSVALLYIAVQSIDNYFVTPMVERRTVLLPPALTISVQILLGIWVGMLGVMLASPLTASLLVIIKMLYIEDLLGDTLKEI